MNQERQAGDDLGETAWSLIMEDQAYHVVCAC